MSSNDDNKEESKVTANIELENFENGQTAESNKTKFKDLPFEKKISYVREFVTVEPLVMCYVMATVLCGPALLVLEYEKACRVNEGYNDTICDEIIYKDVSVFINETLIIQTTISNMHSWQQPLQYVVPIVLVLFLGSYSDRHRIRKPFLLMPIIGEFLAIVGCMLCVVFMKTWPLEAQGISQTVLPSFFGGPSMLVMSAFAYIADVSSIEMRTLRVGVVQFLLALCSPIVQSFSAKLFYAVGYLWIFAIAAVLFALGLLYGFFFIKEPRKSDEKIPINDIFNPKHVKETFMLLYEKKKGNSKLLIILLMVNLFIYSGVVQAELSVFYSFVVNVYRWSAVEHSFLTTINIVIHLIGTAIAIPLFSTYMKLSDLVIGIIAFMDKVFTNLIFGFVLKPIGSYIASVVSIISSIGSIAIRSAATKIVNEDDLGKAQSLFAVTEAIAPAVLTPIYNTGIYINTLQNFPGAFFIVGAALYFLGAGIFLIMEIYSRKYINKIHKNGVANEGYVPDGNREAVVTETTYI